ncbi:MAG TPA: D-alanine--D-alanine ligase [Thermodesulfobacteriota bacterium]|nr:D-alanine--D-alanine ligase [Thermodesulfobacteriota bacterium]
MTDPQTLRVAVLYGGKSSERDVSLASGNQVMQSLDPVRYRVNGDHLRDDLPRLVAEAPSIDVALIILHGRYGEDGSVQGLLELLGVAYQGSGVLGSALAMNKRLTKFMYRQAGLPVAKDWTVFRGRSFSAETLIEDLGFPLVIKPNQEGSSFGVTIVRDKFQLGEGLKKAFQLDEEVLVEEYLAGREITCGVLGNSELEALPLVEIIPTEQYDFFDTEAKYKEGASREICPAQVSPEITRQAQEYGIRAHQVLGLRGYSRTDMIVRGEKIILLETNTIPGMTRTSLFPQAAQAAGLTFSALLDRLIELALEK